MTRILQFGKTGAVTELESMLRWRRPAGSKTESRFVREYVDSIPGIGRDAYGNRFLRIGDSPVLWSSHTDSVHRIGGQQSITRDGALIRLAPHEKTSNCLGADCATGVWLMRQMALRGVSGLYVWHRDEEIGGHGSAWIAKRAPAFLAGAQFAIALDRRGKDSIITHQGARCASDAFARSIMPMLPTSYMPDPTGLFTDTAHYTDLIAECSNLSVGYDAAHSAGETQDVDFACELLEALCNLDSSRLVAARAPGEREEIDWGASWAPTTRGASNFDKLRALCELYPEQVADWLDWQGYDAKDIESSIDTGAGFDF